MIIKQFLWGCDDGVDLDVADDVTCADCVRCHKKYDGTYYCQIIGKGEISPADKHCEEYWDSALYEKSRKDYKDQQEALRLKRIEKNKDKPPVRIQFGSEYDGMRECVYPVPKCPACGEMPYSLEQCYFCGTRFIQDDAELLAYKEKNRKSKEELSTCQKCGGVFHTISFMRNGEWQVSNGWCEGNCGMNFIV